MADEVTYMAMRAHDMSGVLQLDHVRLGPLGKDKVRVEVMATGVCYADLSTLRGTNKNIVGPCTPGHEIAGVVAELGTNVGGWNIGDRVAVGWFGGSCGHCTYCRSGDPVHCATRMTPGTSYPGGWAQSVTVPADALARIPKNMDFFDAAPMGCAGVTVFNAIRKSRAPAGGTVAVFGIGGLGHLAIQFASKMGYRVIAIARGTDKEKTAHDLGANEYIDSAHSNPGTELAVLGGADLIISTSSSTVDVSDLPAGLRIHGEMVLVGFDSGNLTIPASQLVMKGQTVSGHLTGSAFDIEETMRFAARTGVRPIMEKMPLRSANEAVQRLAEAKARFRIVFDPKDVS